MAIEDQYNNLLFSTHFPVDKIGYSSTATYTKSSTGTDQTETVANPLGYKCLPTMSWSIDGTNYYPANAQTSLSVPYSVNISVSAGTITFYIYNNSGSSQTFRIKYSLDVYQ